MRKFVVSLLLILVVGLLVGLVGCVTVNVYFPEAAAQKAADQFIGNVLGGAAPDKPVSGTPAPAPAATGHPPSAMLLDLLIPSAEAADLPDIRIETAQTQAINARMRDRFGSSLGALLDSGTVGFSRDGLVAMRDAAAVPLNLRAQANATIADENRDRIALYHDVASANGHPEWAPQIQAAFAKGWIDRAKAGWYFQNASGAWQRK